MAFTGFYWVLLGFTECPSVLLGFTGFYWVLLRFSASYSVLLGFGVFLPVGVDFWGRIFRGFVPFFFLRLEKRFVVVGVPAARKTRGRNFLYFFLGKKNKKKERKKKKRVD